MKTLLTTQAKRQYRAWLLPLTLFAGLWWLLTGGALESWLIGVGAVPLAAWLSVSLSAGATTGQHRPRISLIGVLRFIPYFFCAVLARRCGYGLASAATQIFHRTRFYRVPVAVFAARADPSDVFVCGQSAAGVPKRALR